MTTTTTATYDLAELQKETRMGAMGSETASREIRRIDLSDFAQRKTEIADQLWAVSYTHLTLPTICSV